MLDCVSNQNLSLLLSQVWYYGSHDELLGCWSPGNQENLMELFQAQNSFIITLIQTHGFPPEIFALF